MSNDEQQQRRILIIEDHNDVADIEKLLCEMEGYDVRVTSTGEDGWTAVQEFGPDLVLLDLMLPGELTGNDVLKKIRTELPGKSPKVLVVSALVNPNTAPNLAEPGQVESMGKPFTVNALAERMRLLLESSSPRV